MVLSNGSEALAGSANLTRGGYQRNQEIIRIVYEDEIDQLRAVADSIRNELDYCDESQLEDFVRLCLDSVETQEALLELIREETATNGSPEGGSRNLIPYRELWDHLEQSSSALAKEVLDIAKNKDGNNNTGKVKQAHFGVQRFLQEYPHRLASHKRHVRHHVSAQAIERLPFVCRKVCMLPAAARREAILASLWVVSKPTPDTQLQDSPGFEDLRYLTHQPPKQAKLRELVEHQYVAKPPGVQWDSRKHDRSLRIITLPCWPFELLLRLLPFQGAELLRSLRVSQGEIDLAIEKEDHTALTELLLAELVGPTPAASRLNQLFVKLT